MANYIIFPSGKHDATCLESSPDFATQKQWIRIRSGTGEERRQTNILLSAICHLQGVICTAKAQVPQIDKQYSADLKSLIAKMLSRDQNLRPTVGEVLRRAHA
eukprot:1130885-Amphidinium_carterae.1